MSLADEKAAAGNEQVGDDLRPAADRRQPAERADAREHQVERAGAEHGDRVVELSLDELDVGAGAARELARVRERCG
jgi:hypothetical protein